MAKVLLLLLSLFVFSQASDNQRAQSKLLAEEAAEVEAATIECSGSECKDSVIADIVAGPLVGVGPLTRIVISASFAVTVLCLFIALVRATGLQSGVWVKLA